jgi:hypothetical protein
MRESAATTESAAAGKDGGGGKKKMSVKMDRLLDELRAAGLGSAGTVIAGLAVVPAAGAPTDVPATYHTRASDGLVVRVTWLQAPTAGQRSTAETAVQAHSGALTQEEKIEQPAVVTKKDRALAAAVLRASTQWATLSAANRAKIQAVIDSAADAVIAALTS